MGESEAFCDLLLDQGERGQIVLPVRSGQPTLGQEVAQDAEGKVRAGADGYTDHYPRAPTIRSDFPRRLIGNTLWTRPIRTDRAGERRFGTTPRGPVYMGPVPL